MFDDAGDDADGDALLFIDPRHRETDVIFFSGVTHIVAGMGDGIDAVVEPDENHAVAYIGHTADIPALGQAVFQVVVTAGGGDAAHIHLDGKMYVDLVEGELHDVTYDEEDE